MVKKMTILMPDDLHRELKETSFRKGTTMAKIIIHAVKKSEYLSSNVNQAAMKHITTVRQDYDGKGFLLRMPEDVAEKIRLTNDGHLFLTRRISRLTKKRAVKITPSRSGSRRPENSFLGFVRAEKDGTFLVHIPSENAEKLRLAHDGLKVRWKTYTPDAKLEFLNQGE